MTLVSLQGEGKAGRKQERDFVSSPYQNEESRQRRNLLRSGIRQAATGTAALTCLLSDTTIIRREKIFKALPTDDNHFQEMEETA